MTSTYLNKSVSYLYCRIRLYDIELALAIFISYKYISKKKKNFYKVLGEKSY